MKPNVALGVMAISFALGGCAEITALKGRMNPGKACVSCHDGGRAPAFAVAGTVYATVGAFGSGLEGAAIEVVDATGTSVSLRSNAVGNFYTRAALVPPLQISISSGAASASMPDAPSGNCNSCHHPHEGGVGRLHVP